MAFSPGLSRGGLLGFGSNIMNKVVSSADKCMEDSPGYARGIEIFRPLKSYWRALFHEQNTIPSRSQFDPSQLKSILSHVYMTEQMPDGSYNLRHRGTGLETSNRQPFISTEHIRHYAKVAPGDLETYFEMLFAGPYAEESCWTYFSPDNQVVDYLCFSVPLYGKTYEHRIALGVLVATTNFDTKMQKLCDGTERSVRRCSRYMDLGLGEGSKRTLGPHADTKSEKDEIVTP